MDLNLHRKVALVTGAANGIGSAIARILAEEGAHVLLADVDADAGPALAAELGGAAQFFRTDVTDSVEVGRLVRECARRFGGLHCLINNAGIQSYGSVTEMSEAVWDRTLAVNLKGAFLAAHHALPLILRSGGGVIVNVASVQAFLSERRSAAYTASKSALLGLTRSLAIDYAPQVRCVAVCPGAIDTPMLRASAALAADPEAVLAACRRMHLAGRMGTAREVAHLVAYLCSEHAAFISGQAYRIDSGLGLEVGGGSGPVRPE